MDNKGLAAGARTSTVPWTELSNRTSEFVDEEYLPDDMTLRDPSKLKKEEVAVLLSHWKERQKSLGHRETFQFSHYLGGGRVKVLTPAEYPEALAVRPRALTTQARRSKKAPKKTTRKAPQQNTGSIEQTNEIPAPRDEDEAAPAQNMITAPSTSQFQFQPGQPAPFQFPPADPQPFQTMGIRMPAHSYSGWPPAPVPDGSGPNDEIQYQAYRQEVVQRHGQDGAFNPNIDPTLQDIRPPIAPPAQTTPRRVRFQPFVLLTPRRSQAAQSSPILPDESPTQPAPARPPKRKPRQKAQKSTRVRTAPITPIQSSPVEQERPRPRPKPVTRKTGPSQVENSDEMFVIRRGRKIYLK